MNVLFYVDEVLCPVSLETLSVDGFLSFLKSIKPIQKYKSLDVTGVLPTFLDGRVKQSAEILGQIEGHFQDRLYDPIHYSVRLSECPAHGQTIYEYSPRDRGAEDYTKLVGRIRND